MPIGVATQIQQQKHLLAMLRTPYKHQLRITRNQESQMKLQTGNVSQTSTSKSSSISRNNILNQATNKKSMNPKLLGPRNALVADNTTYQVQTSTYVWFQVRFQMQPANPPPAHHAPKCVIKSHSEMDDSAWRKEHLVERHEEYCNLRSNKTNEGVLR